MKIIIIGCGKIGTTLAQRLCAENHDVVLVDTAAKALQAVPEQIDALRITGNGASIFTQQEAGVNDADILVAVTGADEVNLLCCLIAQKAGHCQTIARVRNPVYSDELDFIKAKLGISMIINPELAAATEIARLLRFPSAIKLDTFANDAVELLTFRIQPEFGLNGMTVAQMAAKYKSDVLICGVARDQDVFIPNGDFRLADRDKVSIAASPQNAQSFFKSIGLKTNQVRSCMIVGGGTVAYYLAKQLRETKVAVKIVEQKPERASWLNDELDDVMILNADGTDIQLLQQEGLARTEALVTLTNMDEENILLSMSAKEVTAAKLVTKVNRTGFDHLVEKLDLGSVIYPKNITADYIVQYVRSMQNASGSNVETVRHILEEQAEALEFSILERSAVTGVPLSQLRLRSNLLLAGIFRGGRFRIPRGQDTIEVGDTVLVVTTHQGLGDIQDILRR